MVASITGVVSLVGGAIDGRVIHQLEYLTGSNRASSRIIRSDSAVIVVQTRPGSKAAGTEALVQAPMMFAADARLTNRDELGALLSLSHAECDSLRDSALLMRLYRRFGPRGIAQALGAFAFVAWDESERRLVLGRDCLGERGLFYHVGDGFVAFASELNALLALPVVPRTINEEALANFVVLNIHRPSQTLYRGIERVPSRNLVTIDFAGARRAHYWAPDFDAPPPYKRDEDYVLRARELFDQAVLRATTDTPHVAISASGGLDSSAIAATVARLSRAQSITCFTLVPPRDTVLNVGANQYLTERDKVEALARMYPGLKVEYCEEGALHPFEEDPARYFALAGQPARNGANLGAFSLLTDSARQAGYSAALIGTQGNFGLTWAGRFSLLTLLRQGRIGALVRDFRAVSRQSSRGAFRTFAANIVFPALPPWLKRILHRVRGRDPYDVSRFTCLNSQALRDFDMPRVWREDGFDPWSVFPGWEPARLRAAFLFDRNQYARDYLASQSIHGLEYRDPHGDRTLLEFALRVPEPLYRRGGVDRSFARKVFADRLPPEIVNELRRGYQGATWFSRLDGRRQALAEEVERIAASPLASRLLDMPRMKRILDDWPKDAQVAETRRFEIKQALACGIHIGRFIRWVEGGNA